MEIEEAKRLRRFKGTAAQCCSDMFRLGLQRPKLRQDGNAAGTR